MMLGNPATREQTVPFLQSPQKSSTPTMASAIPGTPMHYPALKFCTLVATITATIAFLLPHCSLSQATTPATAPASPLPRSQNQPPTPKNPSSLSKPTPFTPSPQMEPASRIALLSLVFSPTQLSAASV